MLPSTRFEFLFNKVRKWAAFCGVNTLADEYSPAYFPMVYTGLTIFSYYSLAGFAVLTAKSEVLNTMKHIALSLTVLQAIVKLFNTYNNGKQIYKMNTWVLTIIKENENSGGELQTLTYRYVKRMENLLKIAVVLYVSIIFILEMIPFVTLVATGEPVLMFSYNLPFSSPTVVFLATYFIQLVQKCVFITGVLSFDCLLLLQIVHLILLVDIFKLKLSAIDQELVKDDRNLNSITTMLVDAISWHQGFCRYTKSTKKYFNTQISVQVVTSTLSITLTIFTILASDWPGGYPTLTFFYSTLCGFCILGTIYETQQQRMSDAIYNFKWYLLSAREQKMVLFMLAKSQEPTVLDIFGISTFNVRTALVVTKTIYSYITMMSTFVN